ncbi:3-isopropylmalate dehydrogenase [soil metagenome]
MRTHRLGIIPGDGIGPEVIAAALVVLDAAEERCGFRTERTAFPWSGEHWLRTRETFGEPQLALLRGLDAVLLGALGHPDVPRGLLEREVIIDGLRRGLDLYANVRPVVLYDARLCPLKGKRASDVDLVIVRENIEDVYGAAGTTSGEGTVDEVVSVPMRFTRRDTERIIRFAFELARERRRHVTLVDKANAIPIQQLWRDVFEHVSGEYPDIEREAMYVDAAAMWLILRPERFDVLVTTNLFGDILSDLGAAVSGGLGAAAGGNIHPGRVSVFEPVHGSAPKYAGRGVASPVGAIAALAMLLRHIGEGEAAAAMEDAVRDGLRGNRIKGVEAGSQPTADVARVVAGDLARG